MMLILSQPRPMVRSTLGLRHTSKKPSQILVSLTLRCICIDTQSTTYWQEWLSQMPSHPITRKSILLLILTHLMSGKLVIACSFNGKLAFFLWHKSPIALERLRLPSTLPSAFTVDPALVIRSLSAGCIGLWSIDNA